MVDILPILPSLPGHVGSHSMVFLPWGGLSEGDARGDRPGPGPRDDTTTRNTPAVWEITHWVLWFKISCRKLS
jgi:hypothetical protein